MISENSLEVNLRHDKILRFLDPSLTTFAADHDLTYSTKHPAERGIVWRRVSNYTEEDYRNQSTDAFIYRHIQLRVSLDNVRIQVAGHAWQEDRAKGEQRRQFNFRYVSLNGVLQAVQEAYQSVFSWEQKDLIYRDPI